MTGSGQEIANVVLHLALKKTANIFFKKKKKSGTGFHPARTKCENHSSSQLASTWHGLSHVYVCILCVTYIMGAYL